MTNLSFDETVRDPETWFRVALQLSATATFLFQELQKPKDQRSSDSEHHAPGCFKAHMLLSGFALENALKAAIVAREAPQIRDGKLETELFGGGKASHDLPSLALKAGLTPNESERELLERLTENVVWAGRYQFPLKEEVFKKAQQRNPRRILIPTDSEIIDRLLKRAAALAGYSDEHGWPSLEVHEEHG